MKIIDSHVHTGSYTASPEDLIKKMDKAGIYGVGCISVAPTEYRNLTNNTEENFEKRLNAVIEFTKNYPDRLFPVLWVHPDEKDIINKIDIAVEKGVVEFKVICNNFFPYEEKMLKLAEKIASTGKPIMFHSGILWDGKPSSKFNRPVNFEELITIPNLKFALAHGSWPWMDECVALYGKFLNCGLKREDITSEMFIDITPGTPEIYREELIKKLFKIGYDVKNNIMFGTDCSVDDYNADWAKMWIDIDNELYKKYGIDDETVQNVYADNYLRFIGKSDKKVAHVVRASDGSIKEI